MNFKINLVRRFFIRRSERNFNYFKQLWLTSLSKIWLKGFFNLKMKEPKHRKRKAQSYPALILSFFFCFAVALEGTGTSKML